MYWISRNDEEISQVYPKLDTQMGKFFVVVKFNTPKKENK